ncbi:transcription factor IIA subunit alpha [Allomyces javanicus]|nr:transcription factor IIA subunit alpha [Allomyces javanicus]
MSNSIVPQLYRDIISKVMEEARDDFEQFGVDEAVLDDLRITWEKKLYETQVADFSTIDPLAEEYYGEAYDAPTANSTTTHTHAPAAAARATAAHAAPTAAAAPAPAPAPAPQPDPPLYAANATYLATLQAAQAQAAAAQAALASGAVTTTAAAAAPPSTYPAHAGFPAPAPQHAMPMYGSFAAGARRTAAPGPAWPHHPHHAHVPTATGVNPNAAPASRGGAGGGVPPPHVPQYDGFDDSDDESDEDVPASRPNATRAGANARAAHPNAAAARAWDPVLDDDEDDEDDDARPTAASGAAGEEDDEDAINSDLDDDDDDDEPLGEGEVENMMLCQYERVNRTKNKWKCVLRDGIVQVDGKDYVFSRITGDFQF